MSQASGVPQTAKMVARLYDALHDPSAGQALLPTDTGNGGMTHASSKARIDG